MFSRYRLVECPKGNGEIFRGDQRLTQGAYTLTVRQAYVRAGDELLPGHLEIDGMLAGRSTWEDLEGPDDDPFTLHLADGRRLNFLFMNSTTGKIKGTGTFY